MKIYSVFSIGLLGILLTIIPVPAQAALDDFYVQPGFGTHQSHGRMGGGKVDARIYQDKDKDCIGWIDDTPNHIITVVSEVAMMVGIIKPQDEDIDPILVVIGPDNEVICANNNVDRVTGFSAKFSPGDYQFFIGSHHKEEHVRYNLVLMEREK